jgi:hypothetical protein
MPDLNKWLEHWPAKVLALAAALLLFLFNRFDSLQVRSFTVPLRLLTDTALVPAQDFNHRVKVTIRGANDLVSAVGESDLEALVDFSSHQGEGVFNAPIQVTGRSPAAENSSLEISVDPLVLNLHLERRITKTIPVRPDFQGQPGKDYELSGFQVVPSVITIDGPRSLVEKETAVSTEPIELRGKTDTFTLKARVEPDSPLIGLPYGNMVDVQGLMTSSLASLVLGNVTPEAVNLASTLTLQKPLPPVRVRLRGTSQALGSLSKDATGAPTLIIVADLTGYTAPGEVPAVELKAVVPDGVELVDLSPAVVPVFLEAKP